MKYTNEEEKKRIRIVFRTFLASKDTNMRKLCLKHNFNYSNTNSSIFRNHISHENANRLIQLVDPDFELCNTNGLFQILKKRR
jgi:hypothetical protein